jgi:hypothetical protein
MLGVCVAVSSRLSLGTENPIDWTISTFYGAGGFSAYLTGSGTSELSALPDNSITLVRYSAYVPGNISAVNPLVEIKMIDGSSDPLVTEPNEWGAFAYTFPSTPEFMTAVGIGSILIDSDSLPGGGFPYTFETDIQEYSSDSEAEATLTITSWSKS